MNELYMRLYCKMLFMTYRGFLKAKDFSEEEHMYLDMYDLYTKELANVTSWPKARTVAEHMAYLAGRTIWKHYLEKSQLNLHINIKSSFELC